MWEAIYNFLTSVPLWEILLIFSAKVIEVTFSTLRIIFIGKGYRVLGTALSFVEIILWVFIASSVITGIAEAPLKGIIYGIGFSTGVYVGSLLESKLAVGKVYVQAIILREEATNVVKELRALGYAVTVIAAQGKVKNRKVLMIFTSRKNTSNLIGKIQELDEDALIVAHEVSTIKGGYINSFRKIAK